MKHLTTLWLVFLPALLSAQKPELIVRQGGHFSDARLVCFSPDERMALSAEHNNIVLWDLYSGKFVRQIEVGNEPTTLAFSTDGASAAAALADSTFSAWNLATGLHLWNKAQLSDSDKRNFSFSGKRWKKTWDTSGEPIQLAAFPEEVARRLPNLAQVIGKTGLPVTDFVFSQNKRLVVVALGEPTTFLAVTPGLPANREGKGGLLVWDMQKDRLLHRLEDIPEIINSVDISADGTRCLSACSDQTVRLWDLQTGKELLRMRRQPAMEHNFRITPDFLRLVMTDYDGAFRSWDLDQRKELAFRNPEFAESSVYSAADFDALELSADGRQLLTASRDFSLKLWNTKPLEPLGKLDDRHNCLWVATALRLSPDGKKALVGSSQEWRVMSVRLPKMLKGELRFITNNAGRDTVGVIVGDETHWGDVSASGDMAVVKPNYFNVSLWDLEKKQSVQVFQTGANDWHPTSDVRFSADGRLAVATVLDKMMAWNIETADRVVNAQGTEHFHAANVDAPPFSAATIGADSKSVLVWNLSDGKTMQQIKSASPLLAVGFHPSGKLLCTLDKAGALTEWDLQTGAVRRKIGGVGAGKMLRYAPDSTLVAVQDNGAVAVWNLDSRTCILRLGGAEKNRFGTEKFFEGHRPEQISLFQFNTDGTRAMSANYDGTLRYWDMASGQLLLTAYFPGETDWVVQAPNGLFDASPGAMQRMYFVVGTEVIDLDQLKERYFEPGLLQKILGLSDEPVRSVAGFDSVALYPRVHLQLDTLKNTLGIRLTPRNGGVGKVAVFINGKEVIEEANPIRKNGQPRDTAITIDLEQYMRFFVRDSQNVISVRAYNEADWLKSALQNVEFRPASARSKGSGDQRSGGAVPLFKSAPSLHILTVGTANYAGTELDLQYSGKDARDMALALRLVGRQLFGDSVFVTLLTTDTSNTALHPTKPNIRKAFENIKKRARAEDILVVYFSGHGIAYGDADRALFYYLTPEIGSFDLSDAGVRDSRTVSSTDLSQWINDIPALKQVLILDACNSGKILENLSVNSRALGTSQIRALDRLQDRTGMFVLTGSAADKVSYEAGEYGQGLLTYSILQFMKTLGTQGERPVDVMNLFQYAADKVPELAKGIGGVQTPLPAVPRGGASFDIGIVNEQVNIPLAEKKKVFIRGVFMDENLGDAINLAQETERYFREITARGEQAKLIYLDIGAYENGYSIRGRYRVEGKVVKLSVNLFRNNKALSEAPLEVAGSTDAVPDLVKKMVQAVSPLLKKE